MALSVASLVALSLADCGIVKAGCDAALMQMAGLEGTAFARCLRGADMPMCV